MCKVSPGQGSSPSVVVHDNPSYSAHDCRACATLLHGLSPVQHPDDVVVVLLSDAPQDRTRKS